ncbi:protein LBH-like [Melanotaenia boesemani]|uniref:protein LBH-like n=1 Tax=Melanotaenia boesemani TaxID=1250792 RepID=UPI001C050B35|nr:protein LBH-like [Melanotaenia boesemani]
MSCIPASHSMNTILSPADSQMEEGAAQRRGSRAYQIFPEVSMNDESDYPEEFLYRRERLPSIVVEPTEYSEQESGELRWPPHCLMSKNVGKDDDDEEEESSADHTEGSVDGENPEDMRER